ncbi:glycosyltransferase [Buchananella hordeovulneris]|uniref:glycosyltransferase n=1 Tax=Buchananella hordeovulneris TaxID=52770 RepID=UPI0026DC71A5|nr:glycosyltransferase [Buchananella hordeovulneris]MDO5079778.1 glycosyltransferase [Buchananella hordeovulneris]
MTKSASARPRVLIVSRIWAPEPAAASWRLAALREQLLWRGARVRVLTAAVPASLDPGAEQAVSRWPVKRDANGYIRGVLPYLSFDLPLVVRLLAARRPDVVVCESPVTTGTATRLACRLRRIPFVYYAADLWYEAAAGEGHRSWVVRLLRRLEGGVFRAARRVLAVSAPVADKVAALGGRSVLVGNGVDTTVFSYAPVAPAARPTFIYAGTAAPIHGATLLARAFVRLHARHPEVRLEWYGQGPDWDEIAEILRPLPPDAYLLRPRVSGPEIAAKLRAAWGAVATIRPGHYGFAVPSKAYAAAACGAPTLRVGPTEVAWQPELGPQVPYTEDDVEAGLAALVAQGRALQETGQWHATRAARAAWVANNASLAAAGERAATAVLACL